MRVGQLTHQVLMRPWQRLVAIPVTPQTLSQIALSFIVLLQVDMGCCSATKELVVSQPRSLQTDTAVWSYCC